MKKTYSVFFFFLLTPSFYRNALLLTPSHTSAASHLDLNIFGCHLEPLRASAFSHNVAYTFMLTPYILVGKGLK